MPPTTVLWPLDPHTAAKHRVLRKYLDAWIPIMSTQAQRLAVIDGFAGPGRYRGGEPGSPLVMIDAFVTHDQRRDIEGRTRIEYLFVENHRGRYERLVDETTAAARNLPAGWSRPSVVHGDFGEVVAPRLDSLGTADVPIFLFVDPFGWTDPPPELSSRLLSFRRCETLIFVPTNYISSLPQQPGARVDVRQLLWDG